MAYSSILKDICIEHLHINLCLIQNFIFHPKLNSQFRSINSKHDMLLCCKAINTVHMLDNYLN